MLDFSRNEDGTFRSSQQRRQAKIRFGLGIVLVVLAVSGFLLLSSKGELTPDAVIELVDVAIQGLETIDNALSPAVALL